METSEHSAAQAAIAGARAWSRRLPWWLTIGLGWVASIVLALVVVVLWMTAVLHPPRDHVGQIALYLALSGMSAVALGAGALWLVHRMRGGALWLKFVVPAVLAALIIGINVAIVAQLMFISTADSALVFAFLLYGILIALILASSVANAMTQAIRRVEQGARQIAAGDYAFRVPTDDLGNVREMEQLARWFNQMAQNVQESFEMRQQAEENRRNLIAALSHDVRTPLAAMRAMIEAIDDGVVSDPATIRRYQSTVRAEMRHLSVLLDDLFEVSRIQAGTLRLEYAGFAIQDLISDVLEASHEQAERMGIHLLGRVDGDVPALWGDARQIYRVLVNLVQNALRYTPMDGAILIRASVAPNGSSILRALVQVIDTGEGIAAHDLPHIFDSAYRGEASRKRQLAEDNRPTAASGAGLGLAIAHGIIEAHGGKIWAESPLLPATRLLFGNALAPPSATPGTAMSFTLPIINRKTT